MILSLHGRLALILWLLWILVTSAVGDDGFEVLDELRIGCVVAFTCKRRSHEREPGNVAQAAASGAGFK
jgi:hypothetical protein